MECKTIYEYCILRYVPDIERGEWINVGLLMMSKRARWMRTQVLIDERRLVALSPKADIARLRTQLGVFLRDDVPARDLPVEERYRWMAAVKSAAIQTSPSHPGLLPHDTQTSRIELCTLFEHLFEKLFSRLVAPG